MMRHSGAPRDGISEGLKWGAVGDDYAERLCVAFMGYGGWLEPFEYGLFTRLAQQLAARIVIVESPGFGTAGTRLSPRERAALLVGSFVPIGSRMLRCGLAGLKAVGADPHQGIHILGYSMGGSVGAAATSVATDDLSIRTLTLVEPIAIKAWAPWRLLKASGDEPSRPEHVHPPQSPSCRCSGTLGPRTRRTTPGPLERRPGTPADRSLLAHHPRLPGIYRPKPPGPSHPDRQRRRQPNVTPSLRSTDAPIGSGRRHRHQRWNNPGRAPLLA